MEVSGSVWRAALGRPSLRPEAGAPPTCGDAVELPQRQVLHLVLLEAGRAGTINGSHCGVGVCQPLHQPLHLAVTVKGVAPQVPDRDGDGGDTKGDRVSAARPTQALEVSEADIIKAAAGCSHGIFVPIGKGFPSGWMQPRGHMLGPWSGGSVQPLLTSLDRCLSQCINCTTLFCTPVPPTQGFVFLCKY